MCVLAHVLLRTLGHPFVLFYTILARLNFTLVRNIGVGTVEGVEDGCETVMLGDGDTWGQDRRQRWGQAGGARKYLRFDVWT